MHFFLATIILFSNLSIVCADSVSDIAQGKRLYKSYGCALCHGKDGFGDGINAQKFSPSPTNFHEAKAWLHGRDEGSIRSSIVYGIKEDNSIMPAFDDIPAEELKALIAYLKSLS